MELIVSLALLTAVMVMVSQIFKISTDAASRTKAQSEVFSQAAAFRQLVTNLLSKMEPGFLAIECPPPTTAHAEHRDGPVLFRLRQDRIVFVASGRPDEFQSFADPGYTNQPPTTSSQALVYFGPGITRLVGTEPMNSNLFLNNGFIPADEWIISHRALLLGVSNVPNVEVVPPNNIIPQGSAFVPSLDNRIRRGTTDIIGNVNVGSMSADTLITRLNNVNIFAGTFGDNVSQIWEMNYTPPVATMGNQDWDVNPNHYSRSGFSFAPHVADLRIDWTDGRSIDPFNGEFQTRWFGLRPNHTATYSNPNSIGYRAHMRSQFNLDTDNPRTDNLLVNPPSEFDIVQSIEWSPGGTAPATQNRYRAIWQAGNWSVRPKALRFTFRVFDSNGNLSNDEHIDLNEDGLPDDFSNIDGNPDIVKRYGQEFSFIVPLS